MNEKNDQRIVPGIVVNSQGQATVDPPLAEILFELAVQLEEPTNLPVDVEHVLAAIVLAARNQELDANEPLNAKDPALAKLLEPHVKTIFTVYGGQVGNDE